MGDSAVRLLSTLRARSAWCKAAEKTTQQPDGAAEAKAVALHP
jgi:hypothetical protein